jgi:hypothetical protein
MNKTTSKFQYRYEDAVGQYFGSGWAFFLPYLFLYLFFWATGWRIQTLTTIFYFLHSLHAIGLIYFICLKFRTIDWRSALFWLALASLFFNVGAYLEFPSDPWEHLWRIFQWQHLETIAEAQASHKFAYFLGYSLIGWTEPINKRLAIDIYSSTCLLLLAFQTYKLVRFIGLNQTWAKLGVLSNIFFLGYDSIGFYSYHGISSSQISLLASLAAIRATVTLSSKYSFFGIIVLLLALLLSCFNHIQGGLIWSTAALAISIAKVISTFGWKRGGGILLAIVIVVGFCTIPFTSHFIESIRHLDPSKLPGFDANKWMLPWGGINPIGQEHFFRTLGLCGIFNVLAGFYFIKKNKLIGWITVMPIALLCLTPVGLLLTYFLTKVENPIVAHRMLYGSLPLLSIILMLQWTCQKFKSNEAILAPATGLILVFLSIIQHSPIFGKSLTILINIPPIYSLIRIDETAQWIHANLPVGDDQYILSDTATQFVVSAHLGSKDRARLAVQNLATRIDSLGGAEGILQRPEIAGVLVLARQPEVDPVGSLLGKASGHWHPQTVRSNLRFIPSLEHELHSLVEHGWKKTAVPPWYNLYSRPREMP